MPIDIPIWLHSLLGDASHKSCLDITGGDGAYLEPWNDKWGIETDPEQYRVARKYERPYECVRLTLPSQWHILDRARLKFETVIARCPEWGPDTVSHPVVTGGRAVPWSEFYLRTGVRLLSGNGIGVLIGHIQDATWFNTAARGGEHVLAKIHHRGQTLIFFRAYAGKRKDARNAFHSTEIPSTQIEYRRLRAALGYIQASSGHWYRPPGIKTQCSADDWALLKHEGERRIRSKTDKHGHDIYVLGDRITVNLNPYALAQIAKDHNKEVVKSLSITRKRLNNFAASDATWRLLQPYIKDDWITIAGEDVDAIESAIKESDYLLTPMQPIKPEQRFGYLKSGQLIKCVLTDMANGFLVNKEYAIVVETEVLEREEEVIEDQPDGSTDIKSYVYTKKRLKFTVGEHEFRETDADVKYLLAHFDIPDPGDIATQRPNEYEFWRRAVLEANETYMVPHGYAMWEEQIEDCTRLLMNDGGLFGAEQGAGKTACSMIGALCAIKYKRCDGNVLIVCPQDLIRLVWRDQLKQFCGIEVEQIKTVEQARRIATGIKNKTLKPKWYIVHYEALALTGTKITQYKSLVKPSGNQLFRAWPCTETVKTMANDYGAIMVKDQYVKPFVNRDERGSRYLDRSAPMTTCPRCGRAILNGRCTHRGLSHGEKKGKRRVAGCGYVHKALQVRSIGHELAMAFRAGMVIVDEGTQIQGDSMVGDAVAGLRARCRWLLTGTPAKSFVHQIFRLYAWVARYDTPMFPFAYIGGYKQFQSEFSVIRKNTETGTKKVIPEPTNLSMLWRLLNASMVRRRVHVPYKLVPVEVPMSGAQRQACLDWLGSKGEKIVEERGLSKLGAAGFLLTQQNYVATAPEASPLGNIFEIDGLSNWTPANLKCLELAAHHAARGEKFVIGSDVKNLGPWLAEQLNLKGIPTLHMMNDGGNTLNPEKRADILEIFRDNPEIRGCCVGTASVKAGHNLDVASVWINNGFPWDFMTWDQSFKRVVRRTSKLPITVYAIMAKYTLAVKKWVLLGDKTDGSDLALDGELSTKYVEPVPYHRIVEEMREAGFAISAEKAPLEADIRRSWEERPMYELEPLLLPMVNYKPAYLNGHSKIIDMFEELELA